MERRLAAILAADVVGYSRLMEADEVGVLGALKGHREELINPKIADHHGNIVKLMGDGALVEFASVVDAVECALAIQRGMAERNAEATEECRIDLRIGVHLGDIIVEGADIYGDGVNIAARLEGLSHDNPKLNETELEKAMTIFGYARASTLEQGTEIQIERLKAAGCEIVRF